MQTFIIIITNVFNFEKKNYYCFNNMTYSYKTWRQDNISEACANNSGFLACIFILVWILWLISFPLMDLQYFITFLICWFLQRAWIRRKYGHSWDGVRSLQFLFFTWVFFLIDLIFTFSFTFVFVFLLSSFIVLLLFINSITVILKDSFCSLYSIFYTFAMWRKFYDLIFLYRCCYMVLFLYFTIGHSWGLP